MDQNMIKVVYVEVGEEPRVIEVEHRLDNLQRLVGGNIEAVPWVFEDCPTIWVNEEGLLNGSMPNRAVYATDEMVQKGVLSMDWKSRASKGDCVSILYGNFFCAGFNPNTGETVSVTDEEAEKVIAMFSGEKSINSGVYEQMLIQLGLH